MQPWHPGFRPLDGHSVRQHVPAWSLALREQLPDSPWLLLAQIFSPQPSGKWVALLSLSLNGTYHKLSAKFF